MRWAGGRCGAPAARLAATVALMAFVALAAAAQTGGRAAPSGPLHVRAILVDGQLNQRPVPRLQLRFAPAAGGAWASARTDFDGQADLELRPGAYTLTTPVGVSFDGQTYTWRLRFIITTAPLTLTLSNDNALPANAAAPMPVSPPPAPGLEAQFQRLRSTVVTVWSGLHRGTGFIVGVRPNGMAMVLTSNDLAASASALAVQTDPSHKVTSRILSQDPDHDLAALAVNLGAVPGVTAASLAGATAAAVPTGAPVFTIGNAFQQGKVLNAGIVGKNDPNAFVADLNLGPGAAGAPLFAADGDVIAVVTGTGVAAGRATPIAAADAVLRRAETKFEALPPLSPALLPVVPSPAFPAAALRQASTRSGFDPRSYQFNFAGYDVSVITPPLLAWWRAHRARGKLDLTAAEPPIQELGAGAPVVWIEVTPHLKATTSSLLLHALTSDYTHGRRSRAVRRHPDAGFVQMELSCGASAVTPIAPGRVPVLTGAGGAYAQDSFSGLYAYSPDAFRPACGGLTLTIYGSSKDARPQAHVLSPALVRRIWDDFAAWRAAGGS